jgi:hypothetical protein
MLYYAGVLFTENSAVVALPAMPRGKAFYSKAWQAGQLAYLPQA